MFPQTEARTPTNLWNIDNFVKLDTLAARRKQLCLSFARKASKDSKFKVWFSNLTKPTRTDPSFALPRTRTAAYEKSPLVYLTKLLNIQ